MLDMHGIKITGMLKQHKVNKVLRMGLQQQQADAAGPQQPFFAISGVLQVSIMKCQIAAESSSIVTWIGIVQIGESIRLLLRAMIQTRIPRRPSLECSSESLDIF